MSKSLARVTPAGLQNNMNWKNWLKNKFVWFTIGGAVFTLVFAKLNRGAKLIAYAVVLAGLLVAWRFFKISALLVISVLIMPTLILLGEFLPSQKRYWVNGQEYDADVTVTEVTE